MSEHAVPPRTLGLRDLVLAQILIVIGLPSLGPAARLGSLHWVYWLLGIALFHIPLAMVVIHLSRNVPVEGGPYQWARTAYNDATGFLVAWNLWAFITLFLSTLGLSFTAAIGYAMNAGEAWMSNRLLQMSVSAVVTALIVLLAIAGFGASKWLYDAAAIALLVTGAVLIALPFVARPAQPVVQSTGTFSIVQAALFTRVAVFSLAGFECMSIVIAECRDGVRAITRSIMVAVPCIAAIYILGTRTVLAYVPASAVDLTNPVSQTFALALGPWGRAGVVAATAAIVLLVARDFAQSSQVFAAASRLPLVAGWDGYLPHWLTRLHPRTQTPVSAILFAGAVMLASAVVAILAAGRQEAFQILLSTGSVFFASTYLVMFSIPIVGKGKPWWLRLAALSGFVTTGAFLILTFVPVVDVASPARYAMTIGAIVVATNALGAAVFVLGRHRSDA